MALCQIRYVLLFAAVSAANASTSYAWSVTDLHLDQEMDGREYQAVWEQLALTKQGKEPRADDPLTAILTLGKRNLQWIDAINAHRGNAEKLELSTAESQVGIPIDNPRESNRTIIGVNFTNMKAALPKEMAAVLFATTPLTDTNPIDDATFIKAARDVDRVYQMASRWLLQEPNLSSYKSLSRKDIRGYHFLNKEANLDEKLTKWEDQSDDTRNRIFPLLVNLCHNSGSAVATCRTELTSAIDKDKSPKAFYNKYIGAARSLYNSFFDVQNPRSDANYTSTSPNSFTLPFKKPAQMDVENWLKDNIQDEWRFKSFQLTLNFATPAIGAAFVTFVAGATPNVNGLGGSKITMDANRNIQEYTSRWTIRHEFGHVIGYPDCYIEYYDAERQVMINYQIDITNLMCSRRGHLQEQHLAALQKAYWKKK